MQQNTRDQGTKGQYGGEKYLERGRHTDLIKSSTRRQANWRSAPRSQHPTDTRTTDTEIQEEGLWTGWRDCGRDWGIPRDRRGGGTSSQISDHETHPQLEGGGAHKNHMMNSQGDDHHYGLHLRH